MFRAFVGDSTMTRDLVIFRELIADRGCMSTRMMRHSGWLALHS